MKIVGYTVGTSLPKPDFNQTDPKKGDYIKNKPDIDGLQSTINAVSELVGDKSVSTQIDDAISKVPVVTVNNTLTSTDATQALSAAQGKVLNEKIASINTNMENLGAGDMLKSVYDTDGDGIVDNAEKVNGHTVNADVPSGAKFTDTVYTHPGYTAKSSGMYKVTVDSTGHVSATSVVSKSDITALGIPSQDTTYSEATTSKAGLMSAADKQTLDTLDEYVGDKSVSSQISTAIANKSDVGHKHTAAEIGADASGSAANALTSAKSYTDTKISDLINGAPTTLDTLGEIATAMANNADVVSALNDAVGTKANASDLTAHTSNKSNPHGVTLTQLGVNATATELNYVDGVTSAIQTQLNAKVPTSRTVNGKALSSNVTLSASDVGADASGSANTALTNAKAYTDAEITEWVGDKKVSEQITTAIASKSDTTHNHDSAYAAKSHGNHVPATETANNAKFLRNDNTWATVTPANIGAAESSHGTHVTFTTTAPKAAGTASVGTATTVSRSDHVHPAQTSITGNAATATKATQDASGNVITSTYATKTELTAVSKLVGDTAVSTQISTAIANKVDKVSGKGLSTNDYTTTEKNKLSGIATGAEVNQNAFSNITVGSTTISADSKTDTLTLVAGSNVTITPDATNDKITIAATDTVYTHPTYTAKSSGLYKVTVDSTGHVSATTAVTKADITGLGIPAQDTTYSAATTSASGLMSAEDKTKLNGIATGANKTTVDSALSSTSTNPVQNKVINTAINNLNTLVGDKKVSEQISTAVAELDMLSIDITDVDQGTATGINAETLGGKVASDYVLETELDTYKYALETELDTYKTETSNSILQNASIDLEGADETGTTVMANADLLAGMTYQQIMDSVYPIGRVIMTFVSEDPNMSYPWQTWERTANGRFLLGADDSYAAGSMGGEESHTLSIEEMPAHNHPENIAATKLNGSAGSSSATGVDANIVWTTTMNIGTMANCNTEYTGGSQPHNNMPPYLAINMWKRTA